MLHKVVGTVLALAGPGMVLAGLVAFRTTEVTHPTQVVGGGDNPNPLMPPMVEAPFPWWVLALVLGLVWIAGWIWLLIAHRARR